MSLEHLKFTCDHRRDHLARTASFLLVRIPVCLVSWLTFDIWATSLSAAASLNTQEANPSASHASSVPVGLQSDTTVRAFQTDVLFDSNRYDVTSAVGQPEGMLLDSRLIAPGQLRVVVYPQFSGNVANGTAFNVPLSAKSGTVADFPVVLANFLVVGEDASPLATGIAPQVKLLGLKDGADLAGRLGIELSVNAQAIAGTITQVQYYIGGVLIGVGTGPNFRLLWIPSANGPYEITAVATDSNGNVADSRTIPVMVSHIGTYAGTVHGTYVGLVRDDKVTQSSSGYVSMTSTTTGAFTVSLRMGEKTYPGSGKFDSTGLAIVQFTRTLPLPKLTLQLTQSTSAAVDQIHGRLTDGTVNGARITGSTFVTEFTADRVVWSASRKPVNFAGNYTLLMPPGDLAPLQKAPLGTGYARMAVDTVSGAASVLGQLGDGSAFVHSTYVSKDGRVPLYASVHAPQYPAMVSAWLTLRDTATVSDGDGMMDWLRGSYASSEQFNAGFVTQTPLIASRYVPPAVNSRAIVLANVGGNAKVALEDGGLTLPIQRIGTLDTLHKMGIPIQAADGLSLALNPQLGTFHGAFFHPADGKLRMISGVMFQKQNLMSGHFRSRPFNGSVYVHSHAQWPLTAEDAMPLGTQRLPLVNVTSPAVEQVLPASAEVLVSGRAVGGNGIKEVWCHHLHDGVLSEPVLAEGTTTWTYRIPLGAGEGGRFTVFAISVDNADQQSDVSSMSFLVSLLKPLTVMVNGPGSVTRGYLGTTDQQVGKVVMLSATPAFGKKFVGWSGGATSSSPELKFLMVPNFSVTANFADP